MTEVLQVPITQLFIGPDHPPGCHLPAILDLLDGSRTDDRPLEVRPAPEGRYEIVNGRHRYLAAIIAGEPEVEVVVHRPYPTNSRRPA